MTENSFGFTKDADEISRRPSFASSLDSVLQSKKSSCGFLMKKSTTGRWNKRFIVVHGHYLSYYYKDPSSSNHRVPLGALDLWHVEGVALDDCTIILKLSHHAFHARLEEMGGETVKKMINSSAFGVDLTKRLDHARRGAGASPTFTLKASSPKEAQFWLTAMQESPLLGSLATLHKAIEEENGSIIVKELRIEMPPNRDFLFSNAMFENEIDILIRNVPLNGSILTVSIISGSNHHAPVEGSAAFEPEHHLPDGNIIVPLPAGVNVQVHWTRKNPSKSRKVTVGGMIFVGAFFMLFILIQRFRISLFLSVAIAVGITIANYRKELSLNNIIIRSVTVLKPDVVVSPKSPGRKAPGSPKGSKKKPMTLTGSKSTDPNVTLEEYAQILELRSRLENLWDGPKDVDVFIKKNEKFLKDWHSNFSHLKDKSYIKLVMDKHILEDYRLVRFLRARKHKLDKAETMVRDSLTWRLALGSDSILEDKEIFPLPDWIVSYVGARDMYKMIRPIEDYEGRLNNFYLRDKTGHLAVFYRVGRMNTRKIFKKLSSNYCYMLKMVIWTTEMLRSDLERFKKENQGKIDSVLTVVADLDGFALSDQLPLGDVISIAKRFFPIFATSYPELLNKVLVFNAPWLFGSVWSALKPFIPEEVLEKIQIHSGTINYDRDLRPYFADEMVPKCYGGKLVDKDTGDEKCLDRVAPFGPNGMPNFGVELLEGTEPKAKAW